MKRLSFGSASLSALTIVLMASSLVGCSVKQNLDEMHDATQDMNKQTKELNQQTKDLGSATTRLENNMAEMYDALKQGDSLSARRASLQAMVDAEEPIRKISEAGKYFMSFEYQLWSGIGEDNAAKREEVAASAAREFMRDAQTFMTQDRDVNPLATDNKAKCLNSIAVAMHILNPKQELLLQSHPDVEEISMYRMIQEALRASVEIREGRKTIKQYPAYVEAILTFEAEAKHLLQVRYNYLGAMAVARVSKIRNGVVAYAGMRYLWNWKAELADKNTVQIREFSRYLSGAIKTRDFMLSVGILPVMDSNLNAILSGVRLQNESLKALSKVRTASASANDRDKAILEFVEAMGNYKGSPVQIDEPKADSKEDSADEAKSESKSGSESKSDEQRKEEQRKLMDDLYLYGP